MAAFEKRQDFRQIIGEDRLVAAEAQPAGQVAGGSLQGLGHVLVGAGHLLHVLKIDDARLVQHHALGRADKEREAERFLQKLNMPGDGRLGDMQRAGGLGNALQLGHLLEHLQAIMDHDSMWRNPITSGYAPSLEVIGPGVNPLAELPPHEHGHQDWDNIAGGGRRHS